MGLVKLVKTVLVAGCAAAGILYTASNSLSKPADPSEEKKAQPATNEPQGGRNNDPHF